MLNLGFRDHVTPALQQLHWLPVEYRIKYPVSQKKGAFLFLFELCLISTDFNKF